MEPADAAGASAVVLGLGNRLLGDDAAGPLVIDRLAQRPPIGATLVDGGTVGLALLPAIEDAAALVAVDAARFGAVPGTVRVFEGGAMDALLRGGKRSAHEIALADLVGAAALTGRLPGRRALVAVEPAQTGIGAGPSVAVAQALPAMCVAVEQLLQRWAS